jgi:hypothetical protein
MKSEDEVSPVIRLAFLCPRAARVLATPSRRYCIGTRARNRTSRRVTAVLSLVAFQIFAMLYARSQTVPFGIVVSNEMVNYTSRMLLPMRVQVSPTAGASSEYLTIVDIRYCGAEDALHAKLVGVAYPGQPTSGPPSAISPSDCGSSLSGVGTRALARAGSPDWLAVVRLRLSWSSDTWNLEMRVADATTVKKDSVPGPSSKMLAFLNDHVHPFRVQNTGAFQSTLEANTVMDFKLAPEFTADHVVLRGALSDQDVPLNTPLLPQSSINSQPQMANVIAAVSHEFATKLASMFSDIKITTSDGKIINLSNLRFSGGNDTLVTAGTLSVNSNQFGVNFGPVSANTSLTWRGADLKLDSVGIDGFVGNVLAPAISSFVKGVPFRPVGTTPVLPIEFGNSRYDAKYDILQASSTPSQLIVYTSTVLREHK